MTIGLVYFILFYFMSSFIWYFSESKFNLHAGIDLMRLLCVKNLYICKTIVVIVVYSIFCSLFLLFLAIEISENSFRATVHLNTTSEAQKMTKVTKVRGTYTNCHLLLLWLLLLWFLLHMGEISSHYSAACTFHHT